MAKKKYIPKQIPKCCNECEFTRAEDVGIYIASGCMFIKFGLIKNGKERLPGCPFDHLEDGYLKDCVPENCTKCRHKYYGSESRDDPERGDCCFMLNKKIPEQGRLQGCPFDKLEVSEAEEGEDE